MDTCICSMVWFICGYTVAFGIYDDSNDFIGIGDAVLNKSKDWHKFFIQWTFAMTSTTIVSGSVAGRCEMYAYFIYTVILTAWVYPIIAHWIWDKHGWLSASNPKGTSIINGGIIDFAGCIVVHTIGGWSGLLGSIFLGPRLGRFRNEKKEFDSRFDIKLEHEHKFGNNVSYQVMGMFFLWFSWYGFNCGGTLSVNNSMNVASKIAVNTTLAGATGGLTSCLLTLMIAGYWSVPNVVNGTLSGLVSITSACAVVDAGSSAAIGLLGGVFYFGSSRFLLKIQIDDPLNAWPVHGICGMWGALCVAFFSESDEISAAGYNDRLVKASRGELFGNQLFGLVVTILWTIFWVGGLFAILSKLGYLRVSKQTEKQGLDDATHGGKAVDFARVNYSGKSKRRIVQQTSVFGARLENRNSSQNVANTRSGQRSNRNNSGNSQRGTNTNRMGNNRRSGGSSGSSGGHDSGTAAERESLAKKSPRTLDNIMEDDDTSDSNIESDKDFDDDDSANNNDKRAHGLERDENKVH